MMALKSCASAEAASCSAIGAEGGRKPQRFILLSSCSTLALSRARVNPPPYIHSFIHSFIHSGHFYGAPSSPLPLRGAPDYSKDTVSEYHAEAHRQLQVKDLPKVPT